MTRTRLTVEPEATLATQIAPAVRQRQSLIAEREALQLEIRALSDEIGSALVLAGEKRVTVDEYAVSLVESQGSVILDKSRLLELGVQPEVIVAATRRGASTVSLQVRKLKPGAEGEEAR